MQNVLTGGMEGTHLRSINDDIPIKNFIIKSRDYQLLKN